MDGTQPPALIDTNVLLRHLLGGPPKQAKRATAFLRSATGLYCPDVVFAELLFALTKTFRLPRAAAAAASGSVLRTASIRVDSRRRLLAALNLFSAYPISFVDAYVAALAQEDGAAVVSFDKDFDRIPEIERVEP
ncbi:MAG: PIN domain-containing protein [Actinomycetota bacterium]